MQIIKGKGKRVKGRGLIKSMDQNKKQLKDPKIELKEKIDRARKRLNTLWNERGCTDYDVLKAGMVLDKLINEYQRINKR